MLDAFDLKDPVDRLVMGDWLEEQGRAAEAAYARSASRLIRRGGRLFALDEAQLAHGLATGFLLSENLQFLDPMKPTPAAGRLMDGMVGRFLALLESDRPYALAAVPSKEWACGRILADALDGPAHSRPLRFYGVAASARAAILWAAAKTRGDAPAVYAAIVPPEWGGGWHLLHRGESEPWPTPESMSAGPEIDF
jgi:uncharacterized protein (TIGR02996 family)